MLAKHVRMAVRERPLYLVLSVGSLTLSGALAIIGFLEKEWILVLVFGIVAMVALILLLLTVRDPGLPPPALLSGLEDGADSD
jgi:hypothetical protein